MKETVELKVIMDEGILTVDLIIPQPADKKILIREATKKIGTQGILDDKRNIYYPPHVIRKIEVVE